MIEANSTWRNIFSVDNLASYAKASSSLSLSLQVLLDDYSSIVIPSRGAFPIFHPASDIQYIERSMQDSIEVRMSMTRQMISSPMNNPLILPFSADPGESQSSSCIRRFWTKVLSAIVKRDVDSPYLQFYKFLVEKVAKKDFASVMPSKLPEEKFIFIDTVVSGRAISEIVKSFNSEGLEKCYFILIVDDYGRKLKKDYKVVIEGLVSEGRCEVIEVRDLFTEDRGPGVSGVWSTVYPGMMRGLQERYDWAGDSYGAGTFYQLISSSQVEPREGAGDPKYNMPNTLLYASLSIASSIMIRSNLECEKIEKKSGFGDFVLSSDEVDNIVSEKKKHALRMVERYFQRSLENIGKCDPFSPLDKKTTKELALPRVDYTWGGMCQVSTSGSHLIRVDFSDEVVEGLFKVFETGYLGVNPFFDCGDYFINL
ncbi:hypothetical protein [Halomonas cupida]|uniref:hypothetical protein n=1 Tax=Halomonas cupida TaxID=44933 RepID=UPI003A932B65